MSGLVKFEGNKVGAGFCWVCHSPNLGHSGTWNKLNLVCFADSKLSTNQNGNTTQYLKAGKANSDSEYMACTSRCDNGIPGDLEVGRKFQSVGCPCRSILDSVPINARCKCRTGSKGLGKYKIFVGGFSWTVTLDPKFGASYGKLHQSTTLPPCHPATVPPAPAVFSGRLARSFWVLRPRFSRFPPSTELAG